MRRSRIIFKGHFIEHFLISLLLLILSVLTLGIALPYYFYWNFKYFFTKLEIEEIEEVNEVKEIKEVEEVEGIE